MAWATSMKDSFLWNNYIIRDSFPLCTDECVYLLNHRESIDFPIDSYLTEGRSFFISRWLVFFSVPFMGLLTVLGGRCVYYFYRGGQIDKNKFISDVEIHRTRYTDNKSVNIYPEGTRRSDNACVRIKDGGIYHSHVYNLPIQIIITKNKELVFSLYTRSERDNVDCYTYRSNVFYPRDFKTFEDYRTFICDEWTKAWNIVYNKEYTRDTTDVFIPDTPIIVPIWRTVVRLYLVRFVCLSTCILLVYRFL
jgi:1-acyl-sn-glycerol-3-phosphate acyltransferase